MKPDLGMAFSIQTGGDVMTVVAGVTLQCGDGTAVVTAVVFDAHPCQVLPRFKRLSSNTT